MMSVRTLLAAAICLAPALAPSLADELPVYLNDLPMPLTFARPQTYSSHADVVRIEQNNGLTVRISLDGKVIVTGGTIDDGAKAFWEAVAGLYLRDCPGAKETK